MPRPHGAKVWNEDLKRALKARFEQCRQQARQQQFLWRDGAIAIEGVRKDIYQFKTGRIVGLPTGLKKTVAELCTKIILGTESILPPGYVPTSFEDQEDHQGGNPYDNDPYLKRMKIRGGAFAILMGFHISQSQTMTKDQIIEIAQSFCDEAMEANFHAGRVRGAWSGVDTLKKHHLVQVNKTGGYDARAGGFRSHGQWSFTLTDNGSQFIDALRRRHPEEIGRQIATRARGHSTAPTTASRDTTPFNPFPQHAPVQGTRVTKVPTPRRKASSAQSNHGKDEEELRTWSNAAGVNEQKVFKVGKNRRKHLHDLCDSLNQDLIHSGRVLRHESVDLPSRSRALYVTLEQRGTLHAVSPAVSTRSYPDVAGLNFNSPAGTSPARRPREIFPDTANQLESHGGTPPKRPRTNPAPSMAAGNAALFRQALYDSSVVQDQRKPAPRAAHYEDDGGGKPPAVEIVDLLESDDDDDDSLLDTPPTFTTHTSRKQDIVDLTNESPPMAKVAIPQTISKKLTIYIDSRERNRNASPRHLRMELSRLIHSGPFKIVWPRGMALAEVEEKALGCGDFAFNIGRDAFGGRSSVLVERKTIGDIVQRSAKKHHWWQLQKMRDMCESGLFLLEGDFRTAPQFPAYGSQEDEEWTPDRHTLDSEDSIALFMGRALLSSDAIGFVQTKDEQGSLRAVAALGLVVATASHLSELSAASMSTNAKAERQKLADRLKAGGIPFQLAQRVAEEIGSTKQMDSIYASAEDDECRANVLFPFIATCCSQLESKSTVSAWSAACHQVYFSTATTPSVIRNRFSDFEHLVEDKASLLCHLHAGLSAEEALEATLSNRVTRADSPRSVLIEISQDGRFGECFSSDELRRESFYRVQPLQTRAQLCTSLPYMTMKTEAGLHCSSRLFVFLLEGEELVERVRAKLQAGNVCDCFLRSARDVADKIRSDCWDSNRLPGPPKDRHVLLLRGLQPALERAAKKLGYRSEIRTVVDLVLAELAISRQRMCVLQAVRLKNDLDMILQQLALACFHYQILLFRNK